MNRFIALILFIILMPFLLLLFLLIFVIDRHQPVFIQKRVGLGGRYFNIFKFRSMKASVDLDKDQFDLDKYYTRLENQTTVLGYFLRKYSLDELPQLVNIIIGDMNFIGPRPVLPEQIKAIRHLYYKRFQCKPGITGLSQVMGRRNLSWINQLRLDVFFVEKKSLRLCLLIIFKTFFQVVSSQGVLPSGRKNWRHYID